jgi:hypothetical protein
LHNHVVLVETDTQYGNMQQMNWLSR